MGLSIYMENSPLQILVEEDGHSYNDDPTAINMSYSNARPVMARIGITGEDEFYCGSMPAGEFLVRVVRAIEADIPDEGICATVEAQEGHATLYSMGRREGYVNKRLEQFEKLARAAIKYDRRIVWA